MEKPVENIEINHDEEYVEGGEVYCKKCDRPRARSVIGRKVRVLCDCQKEAWEKEEAKRRAEQEKKDRLKRAERLKSASLLAERYKNASFEQTDVYNANYEVVYKRCKKYTEVSEQVLERGLGIYLYGNKGTGKTHLTACMANRLMEKYYSVLFTSLGKISKSIRETFGKKGGGESEILNKLATIDFLFIDDIGTELVTKDDKDLWLQEKLFEVVNDRYNNLKPIIFTSNYSLAELSKRGVSDKTIDRIAETCEAMALKEESYRAKIRPQNRPIF